MALARRATRGQAAGLGRTLCPRGFASPPRAPACSGRGGEPTRPLPPRESRPLLDNKQTCPLCHRRHRPSPGPAPTLAGDADPRHPRERRPQHPYPPCKARRACPTLTKEDGVAPGTRVTCSRSRVSIPLYPHGTLCRKLRRRHATDAGRGRHGASDQRPPHAEPPRGPPVLRFCPSPRRDVADLPSVLLVNQAPSESTRPCAFQTHSTGLP